MFAVNRSTTSWKIPTMEEFILDLIPFVSCCRYLKKNYVIAPESKLPFLKAFSIIFPQFYIIFSSFPILFSRIYYIQANNKTLMRHKKYVKSKVRVGLKKEIPAQKKVLPRDGKNLIQTHSDK
jgi:hypothetical protein